MEQKERGGGREGGKPATGARVSLLCAHTHCSSQQRGEFHFLDTTFESETETERKSGPT